MTTQVKQQGVDATRAKMARDGWATLPDALDTGLLGRIRGDIARTFGYQFARHGIDAPADWDLDGLFRGMTALFEINPKTFFATARIAQCLPSVMALAGSDGLMNGLKHVGVADASFTLIPNIVFMSTAFHVEGGYNQRPPHQDWLSMQGSFDGMVTWIPLHDVSEDRYPIEVWDGTHLMGVMESERSDCGTRVVDSRLPTRAPTALTMRYGDLSCMSSFLVHRTGNGPANGMRVSIILRYNNLAEPHFIERDYPMPSTMSVAREAVPGAEASEPMLREFFTGV